LDALDATQEALRECERLKEAKKKFDAHHAREIERLSSKVSSQRSRIHLLEHGASRFADDNRRLQSQLRELRAAEEDRHGGRCSGSGRYQPYCR
jgi:hypothetical protein